MTSIDKDDSRILELAIGANDVKGVTRLLSLGEYEGSVAISDILLYECCLTYHEFEMLEAMLAFVGCFPSTYPYHPYYPECQNWVVRHKGWRRIRFSCARDLFPRTLELLMLGHKPDCPPEASREMHDLMALAAEHWSHKNHALHPLMVRARVRLLLLIHRSQHRTPLAIWRYVVMPLCIHREDQER